jgi:PPM family protein phosphatase
MNCPSCNATLNADDRFCEECGTAIAVATALVSTTTSCTQCGAPPQQIDPEGYCMVCGVRNLKAVDRRTIVLSDYLAGASDPGCRYHHNEDALMLKTTVDDAHIMLVCDGVSSSGAAELASQFAVNHTCETVEAALQKGEIAETAWINAIASTHQQLIQVASGAAPGKEPPSTTLVGAVVQGQQVTLAWVGDSRAYWLDATAAKCLTADHSWMNAVVAAGEMTLAEAEKSSQAHAITRWIGADASTEDAKPSIAQFTIPGPGQLILCSDGLWNYAAAASQLAAIVPTHGNALSIAQSLVEQARQCGGHDNITVAILQILAPINTEQIPAPIPIPPAPE